MFFDPDRGFSLLAVESKDGRIRPQRVANIHLNGMHKVYRLELADGHTIRATGNHRFMTDDQSYVTVDEMLPGRTTISVDGGYEPCQYRSSDYRLSRGDRQNTGRVFGRGKENIGYIDGGSIALKKWTEQTIDTAACDECAMTRAEGRLERAHLDGDRTNNSTSNLRWKCVSHHKAHDYRHNARRRRFEKGRRRSSSLVVSVVPDGVDPVYDVEMAVGSDHNFLANGIVSHNSHAVAYGQLAYVTAFLKANWPAAYGAAVLAQTKDEDKRASALLSLAQEGITVLPPQVNTARVATTAVDDQTVVLGLGEVKDVGRAAAHIVAEQQQNGPFTSAGDVLVRTKVPGKDGAAGSLTSKVVEALIESGALDEFGPRRGQLRVLRASRARPDTPVPAEEWGLVERAIRQHHRLGLSLGRHPMAALSSQVRSWNPDLSDEYGNPLGARPMPLHRVLSSGRTRVVTIGLVTGWKVKPDNRGGQRAELRLEGSRGRIEAVVWDSTLRALRHEGHEVGAGSVVGVLAGVRTREIEQRDEEGNHATVEVHSLNVLRMWPLDYTDVDAAEVGGDLGLDLSDHLHSRSPLAPDEPPVPVSRRVAAASLLKRPDESARAGMGIPGTSAGVGAAGETIYVEAGDAPLQGHAWLMRDYPDLASPPTDFYDQAAHLRVYRVRPATHGVLDMVQVVSLPAGVARGDREWHQSNVPAHLAAGGTWVGVPDTEWQVFEPAVVDAEMAA